MSRLLIGGCRQDKTIRWVTSKNSNVVVLFQDHSQAVKAVGLHPMNRGSSPLGPTSIWPCSEVESRLSFKEECQERYLTGLQFNKVH